MISRRDAVKMGAAGLFAPSEKSFSSNFKVHRQTLGDTEAHDRGNVARTGENHGPGPNPDAPIDITWEASTGMKVQATPAVTDRALYLSGTDANGSHLLSLDVTSGQELWRLYLGKAIPFSSPTVVDGVVYAGTPGNLDLGNRYSNDPSEPTLFALDAYSGEIKWSMVTPERVDSSPAVVDGVVYFGCQWPSGFVAEEPHFWALETTTGKELWSVGSGCSKASPAIGEGLVFKANSSIIALDSSTGDLVWSFYVSGNNIEFTPAVHDGVVYVGTTRIDTKYTPALVALDAKSGEERWQYAVAGQNNRMFTSPAVSNNTVYSCLLYSRGSGGRVCAVSIENGEELWYFETRMFWMSAPTIADHIVYVCGGDESNGVQLFALDSTTGVELWSLTLGTDVNGFSFLPTPSPVVADGKVYAISPSGAIHVVGNI